MSEPPEKPGRMSRMGFAELARPHRPHEACPGQPLVRASDKIIIASPEAAMGDRRFSIVMAISDFLDGQLAGST